MNTEKSAGNYNFKNEILSIFHFFTKAKYEQMEHFFISNYLNNTVILLSKRIEDPGLLKNDLKKIIEEIKNEIDDISEICNLEKTIEEYKNDLKKTIEEYINKIDES